MNDEEPTNVSGSTPSGAPSRPSPYELLVRQSKKLGGGATRTFSEVRDILNKDIPLPSADQFLGGLPRFQRVRKQRELENVDKLKQMVRRSQEVLGRARTVFPLKLFPDSIVVDRTKVTLIKREFFWTSDTISFQIEDILNVSCALGPLFGSVTIASRVISSVDHFQINRLWRRDAVFFKRLLQGHIIAKQNGLETDTLTTSEMVNVLCEIGKDAA
jgi:hypothetical protein